MPNSMFDEVREADNAQAFKASLLSFTHAMDFATFSATLVVDRLQKRPEVISISNVPSGFEAAHSDPSATARDPLVIQLRKVHHPVVWDQQTYVEGAAADLWEEQAPFGYRTGMATVMHMPGGRHFYFGLDRASALPQEGASVTRMLADVQLMGVFAQDAARRIWLDPKVGDGALRLSSREAEVLLWTLRGKPASVVAEILGVSEHTAHWHAQRAMKKLGCESKHSAAVLARDLGLI